MPIISLLAALALLLLCRLMKWRGKIRILRIILGGFTGGLLINLLFTYYSHEANLLYNTKALHCVRAALDAVDEEKEKPFILFVGASHSYRGIIPELVEKELEKANMDYNVVGLTQGGMGLLEQDFYLELFLKETPVPPDIVFMEVSKRFESPVREYQRQGVNIRMLAHTDRMRFYFASTFLNAAQSVTGLQEIAFFRLLNALSISLAIHGVYLSEASPRVQHLFPPDKEQDMSTASVHSWLSKNISDIPAENIRASILDWLQSLREHQNKVFAEHSVKKMRFYAPPILNDEYQGYTKTLCNIYGCLEMSPEELRQHLDGPYWHNFSHLNATGAKKYSIWLGRALAKDLSLQENF